MNVFPVVLAFTLIEILVALALLLLAAGLITAVLSAFQSGGSIRTVPSGTSLAPQWATAPTLVTVSQPAAFVFKLQSYAAMSGALTDLPNVTIQFTAGPNANLRIVSINGNAVNSDAGQGDTATDGTVKVVVQATSVPPSGSGALVAIPAGQTQHTDASFEIANPP